VTHDKPGDLPLPTPVLSRRTPIVATLNGPLFRIYREANKTPMFFGKTLDYRFDSASGECGVLYAAPSLNGAFVETFMQELGRTSISLKELSARPVALIYSKRPLRFIDLCAIGGQMRLGVVDVCTHFAEANVFASGRCIKDHNGSSVPRVATCSLWRLISKRNNPKIVVAQMIVFLKITTQEVRPLSRHAILHVG
jgi:hypothetical protein